MFYRYSDTSHHRDKLRLVRKFGKLLRRQKRFFNHLRIVAEPQQLLTLSVDIWIMLEVDTSANVHSVCPNCVSFFPSFLGTFSKWQNPSLTPVILYDGSEEELMDTIEREFSWPGLVAWKCLLVVELPEEMQIKKWETKQNKGTRVSATAEGFLVSIKLMFASPSFFLILFFFCLPSLI